MGHQITWPAVYAAVNDMATELGDPRNIRNHKVEVDKITKHYLGINATEADLLGDGLASNVEWLLNAKRNDGLGRTCKNRKLFDIMQSLFVVDPVMEVFFLTTDKHLERSAKRSGVDWKNAPKITRKRSNKIMNWGTLQTSFTPDAGEHERRVVLIPDNEINDDLVYMSGAALMVCFRKFIKLWDSHSRVFEHRGIKYLGMWPEFYAMAYAAITMHSEHECFSYHGSGSVKCSVYLVDDEDLYQSDYRPAHVKRYALSSEFAEFDVREGAESDARTRHRKLVSCLRKRLADANY
jgi:hypothetical protein